LIERLIVTVEGKTEKVFVEIHWSGGHKTFSHIIRPVSKIEQLSYYNELINRTKYLRNEGKHFKEIASVLNQEGWRPPKTQETFSSGMIRTLLARVGIVSNKKPRSEGVERMPNEWTFYELSQKTNIPSCTLFRWMQKGILKARRIKEVSYNGVWFVNADEKMIEYLQVLKNQPKQWVYRSKVQKVN